MSRGSKVVVTICGLALALGCSHGPTLTRDDLGRQVGDLREEVRLLQQQNKALTDQQKALASQVDQLARSQSPLQVSPPPDTPATSARPAANPSEPALPIAPVSPPAAEAPVALAGGTESLNPHMLYRQAMDLYRAGDTVKAAELFGRFVRQFPESDLADNAQYWLGECAYGQKEYGPALEDFKFVSERFPEGNKVPDALYKQGVCERLLGRDAEARHTFQAVVDRYPGTEAATMASQMIK
jgi:tol-pal system protein YbgF